MMPMGFEYGWSRALNVVMTRDDEPEHKRFDLSEYITDVNAIEIAPTDQLNMRGADDNVIRHGVAS